MDTCSILQTHQNLLLASKRQNRPLCLLYMGLLFNRACAQQALSIFCPRARQPIERACQPFSPASPANQRPAAAMDLASLDTVDLAAELVASFHWDERFATTARSEYLRFLELKGRAKDYRDNALAPSTTVAIVWAVHRQWTFDYAMTCERYGGFVHHSPPFMRDDAARKPAYATTREAYAKVFGHAPPALVWEPFGAQSNGSASRRSSSSSPADRAAAAAQAAAPAGKTGLQQAAPGSATDSLVTPPASPEAESGAHMFCVDPARLVKLPGVARGGPIAKRRVARPKGSTWRSRAAFASSEKRMRKDGYVLRPLRPGEVRPRGRPRKADYVHIDNLGESDRELLRNCWMKYEAWADVGSDAEGDSGAEHGDGGVGAGGEQRARGLSMKRRRPQRPEAGDFVGCHPLPPGCEEDLVEVGKGTYEADGPAANRVSHPWIKVKDEPEEMRSPAVPDEVTQPEPEGIDAPNHPEDGKDGADDFYDDDDQAGGSEVEVEVGEDLEGDGVIEGGADEDEGQMQYCVGAIEAHDGGEDVSEYL